MNWGYKILFVYLAFVAGIGIMVFKSSTQKIDMVTTDYYAKELKYQDKIDEQKRTSALSAPVQCEVKGQEVLIVLPAEFKDRSVAGEVVLYCPSDEKKDYSKPFTVNDANISFTLPDINKGANEIQISWVVDGMSYYFKKRVFL